ncbi:hypothetical protein GBAR_LOCUS27647 [Geodia barretti]|uniref:Uncharacterized protein n=1 Tax=Geodia barretti TaxID=519541 RepID=A0AA35TNQ2_GEOBA|nr:hypothetical protein GBAR_LOCUS27647 [Geodia barretti]
MLGSHLRPLVPRILSSGEGIQRFGVFLR